MDTTPLAQIQLLQLFDLFFEEEAAIVEKRKFIALRDKIPEVSVTTPPEIVRLETDRAVVRNSFSKYQADFIRSSVDVIQPILQQHYGGKLIMLDSEHLAFTQITDHSKELKHEEGDTPWARTVSYFPDEVQRAIDAAAFLPSVGTGWSWGVLRAVRCHWCEHVNRAELYKDISAKVPQALGQLCASMIQRLHPEVFSSFDIDKIVIESRSKSKNNLFVGEQEDDPNNPIIGYDWAYHTIPCNAHILYPDATDMHAVHYRSKFKGETHTYTSWLRLSWIPFTRHVVAIYRDIPHEVCHVMQGAAKQSDSSHFKLSCEHDAAALEVSLLYHVAREARAQNEDPFIQSMFPPGWTELIIMQSMMRIEYQRMWMYDHEDEFEKFQKDFALVVPNCLKRGAPGDIDDLQSTFVYTQQESFLEDYSQFQKFIQVVYSKERVGQDVWKVAEGTMKEIQRLWDEGVLPCPVQRARTMWAGKEKVTL